MIISGIFPGIIPGRDHWPARFIGSRWSTFATRGRAVGALSVLAVVVATLLPAVTDAAEATRGMVATVHPAATDAGVAALRQGGNAADAAIAAAFTLGVVDGHNSGIGGGCFILVRTSDGRLLAIDGRETAPRRATRDMYLRDGKADRELSKTGPLAIGTPGALAAYARLVQKVGRLKLRQLIEPAAKIAEDGFPLDETYASRLALHAKQLGRYEGSRTMLLNDGKPYGAGEVLKLPDLARTYRAIAEHGTDWFYGGPFSQRVDRWMKENGGILSREDFVAYRTCERTPIRTTYRNLTIVGFPPPSSGGVHVAQILNMLEPLDLKSMNALDRTHVVAEAMKRAFADRAHWLGDPDFSKVPRGLLDKAYARNLAATIDPKRATPVAGHGSPPRAATDLFGKRHTTHIAAADAEGNWVAITTTLNTSFGSKVVVPGTGVLLNNQMDDFSAAPGVPNAFGLVGAEANAIAPGKRPLSSMSPTIVLRRGEPIMTLGAAGGPKIITSVVLAIIGRYDLGLSTKEAVAQTRFHHQWVPDQLMVESAFPETLRRQLIDRGHKVLVVEHSSTLQAITRESLQAPMVGVSDPRVSGKAAGL